MFAYCTEVLHLSDAEAYLRIAAARASREHPLLLTLLTEGRLHLTAIAKLAPHLTPENREVLLERAVHRSKRQIEELVAEISPRPDAPALMRKLPDRRQKVTEPSDVTITVFAGESGLRPDAVAASELERRPGGRAGAGVDRLSPGASVRLASPRTRPAVVEPLAPARYKVQFTASAELHDKLERLRGLMRSSVPDGDLATIIEQAVTEKLQRLEARRFARTQAPRKTLSDRASSPTSRRIPAAVKRAVYERDGGRCRYEDAQGRRCTGRHGLEFHHRHPFGHGGDHSVGNISLQCERHNRSPGRGRLRPRSCRTASQLGERSRGEGTVSFPVTATGGVPGRATDGIPRPSVPPRDSLVKRGGEARQGGSPNGPITAAGRPGSPAAAAPRRGTARRGRRRPRGGRS